MSLIRKQRYLKLLAISLALVGISGCYQGSDDKVPVAQSTDSETNSQSEQSLQTIDAQLSEEESIAMKSLLWIKKANLEADFAQAVSEKDFRFWVIATRATTMPGIPLEQQVSLTQSCGQKFLPGAGDTLINKQHRDLYRQAINYAKQYNIKMQEYCQVVDG